MARQESIGRDLQFDRAAPGAFDSADARETEGRCRISDHEAFAPGEGYNMTTREATLELIGAHVLDAPRPLYRRP